MKHNKSFEFMSIFRVSSPPLRTNTKPPTETQSPPMKLSGGCSDYIDPIVCWIASIWHSVA